MDVTTLGGVELVSIEAFMAMLGYKSRVTYYDHLDDSGWPQRVYPAGKPMLRLDDCKAYIAKKLTDTTVPKRFKRSMAGQGVRADRPSRKRHPGRPAKALRP